MVDPCLGRGHTGHGIHALFGTQGCNLLPAALQHKLGLRRDVVGAGHLAHVAQQNRVRPKRIGLADLDHADILGLPGGDGGHGKDGDAKADMRSNLAPVRAGQACQPPQTRGQRAPSGALPQVGQSAKHHPGRQHQTDGAKDAALCLQRPGQRTQGQ